MREAMAMERVYCMVGLRTMQVVSLKPLGHYFTSTRPDTPERRLRSLCASPLRPAT